jgi:ParB family chromosome partitioning protein
LRPPADLAEGVEVQVAAKKKGLGRGLDALLPEADELLPNVVQEIPVGDIDPNTEQPRRSFPEEAMTQLSASVKEQGILQPLLVVEQPGGRYRIVAGERRWRAARQAGLATVPCMVRDMDMIRQMEVSLIENLQREDLNPMEEAAAIRALMQQCGYTQETVAARLSKSRPVIANLLRLLTLPKEVAQMVREGQLSAGHARVLAGLEREEDKIALARETLAKGYSVRQLEQLAALRREAESHGQVAHKVKNARPLPPELKELEGRVRETLGMRATLSGNAKKGKIVLQYYSQEELERLYEVLEKLDTL